MDSLQYLMHGFSIALQPENLLFALIGCTLGTLIGVLPGIGPGAGTAMLIPLTFVLDPTPAIIMLAAIYYGVMYGGTITSVLVNVPGEAASAVTCIDGYQMARKGRAGAALAIAAIGSFIGGSVATMGLVLLALPLSSVALSFGPPEFFALMFMGLSLVVGLAGKSLVRALISAGIGTVVAMVGIDPEMGAPRMAFGSTELMGGFNLVPTVMGIFGVSEIFLNAENPISGANVFEAKMRSLIPTTQDLRDSFGPILRGTALGFFLGLIPGVGSIIATFAAYAVEKRISKHPEKFGTGMIEGVASPETANNSHANAAFVPLFTLGIPASPVMAILMGAFMMNGLTPGPFLFKEHPDFVWAVIASMYVGNVILVILNLPLVPLWVQVLKVPYAILFALILAFCVIGAYSVDNSVFDIGVMLGFGLLGYILKKLDFPLAPFVLTLILAPIMEKALRASLQISDGQFAIFITRPISAVLLIAGLLFVISTVWRMASRMSAVREDSEV